MASDILKMNYGINACVANLRFLKPLDSKLLKEIYKNSNYFVTVEENALQGGFGSAVLEFFEQEKLYDIKLVRLGIPDAFIKHGPREQLLKIVGITPEKIVESVLRLLRGESFEFKEAKA